MDREGDSIPPPPPPPPRMASIVAALNISSLRQSDCLDVSVCLKYSENISFKCKFIVA